MAEVEVKGLDRVKRRLVDVIPKAMRAGLEAAMEQGAQTVASVARALAPAETGELRDSIRSHGVREGKRGGLYVAVTAGDSRTVEPGANGIRYQKARLQEFGTREMPAQPFLLPAYRGNRRRIRAAMRRAIRNATKA